MTQDTNTIFFLFSVKIPNLFRELGVGLNCSDKNCFGNSLLEHCV